MTIFLLRSENVYVQNMYMYTFTSRKLKCVHEKLHVQIYFSKAKMCTCKTCVHFYFSKAKMCTRKLNNTFLQTKIDKMYMYSFAEKVTKCTCTVFVFLSKNLQVTLADI